MTESAVVSAGDPAPDVELPDHTGTTVRLSELWKGGGLVLHFLRHLGCPFCRELVVNAQESISKFEEAGVGVAAVSMAPVEESARFRQQFSLSFPMLSDPQRQAYVAYGLTLGSLWQIVGPATITGKGLASVLRFGVGRPIGDVRQLSGTFVIDESGTVLLAHRAKDSVDNLSQQQLLDLVTQRRRD